MGKKIYTFLFSFIFMSASSWAYTYSSYNAAYSDADYRQALNMSLKFFGGQRCGNTGNWMLMDNSSVSKKYCHTKDGQGSVNGEGNGSYDLSGGWHDCGDHIKVATTMGYAAVSLLVSYDLWPAAFQDNYDGVYGAPNNIPDVLDEVKVATDYFIKSFVDDNTFVYYVGYEGDHNVWVTSSVQSDMAIDKGGDPRPICTATDKGGPQAANYASALALMAMKYPDADYKNKCKEYAVKAYNFAVKNKSTQAPIPQFYPSPNSEWTDELSLAAILLYELTGESQYYNQAVEYLQGKWESHSPLAWDTMSDFTYYYIVKNNQAAGNGQGGTFASFLEKNVFALHITNGEANANGFPYYTNTWGTNKLACGGAVAAALFIKLVEDGVVTTSYDIDNAKRFNERIVDYVLGNNEFNHTFLHGYKGDMTHRLHHRNAMGRNDNPVTSVKNSCDFMFASGGMLGGPSSTGVFSNVIEGGSSYTETEGGCDYNAPFVAAIARIVAEKDPVELSGMNESELTESSFLVYPTLFDDYIAVDLIEHSYHGLVEATLLSLDGRVICKKNISDSISSLFETSSLSKGMYFIQISNEGKTVTYKLMKN